MKADEIIKLSQMVIQTEMEGIKLLKSQIDNNFVKAVHVMLKFKGHVLVTGIGTSRSVANRLAHLLSCCGTPALYIHPGDGMHGLAGAVTKNDVLIAVSRGGKTEEVIHMAQIAKNRKAAVISITENAVTDLTRLSDVVVTVKSPQNVDVYGVIATGSSLMYAALGDALCVVLLKLRGYSLWEFGKTHPGGAVGEKLKKGGKK